MRTLLVIFASVSLLTAKAQTALPIPSLGYGFSPFYKGPDFNNNKWQLKPFASISAGYIWLNGGISYIAAPVGVALYKPLTQNVTAFGAVSAAPVFLTGSRFYANQAGFPGSGFSQSSLNLSSRVEAGLMYTNDAKTFSISGSIGVERSTYPMGYPVSRPPSKNQ